MSRWVYVNGVYCPYGEAVIHVEDRGYQFADGVYEVCPLADGRVMECAEHLTRLRASAAAINLVLPDEFSDAVLSHLMHETARRNRVREGMIYLQLTRGQAERKHEFPTRPPAPALVILARRADETARQKLAQKGICVALLPDQRWARCDIKSIALLPNVLARQQARELHADEAWLVKAGYITEGAASNAWIVSDGVIRTHPADEKILGGITRLRILAAAKNGGLSAEERAFTPQEAFAAQEAFTSSSLMGIMPVVKIDGQIIGGGKAGAITKKLTGLLQAG